MTTTVIAIPEGTLTLEQVESLVARYEAATAEAEMLHERLIELALKQGRKIGEGASRQIGRAKVIVSAGSMQLDHEGAVAYIKRYHPELGPTLIEDSVRVPAWKKAVQDAKIPNDVAAKYQSYKADSKSLKITEKP